MSFVKLDRAILQREWYKDANASRLYMHLLMSVDYQTDILTTHQKDLAYELGLSIQNIKTALKKLEATGDIVRESDGKHLIIRLIQPDKVNHKPNHKLTDNQLQENTVTEPITEDTATENQPQTNHKSTIPNNIYKYIYINNNKRIREERSAHTHEGELSDADYQELVNEYGKDMVDAAIEQVRLYSQANGKYYKDVGAAIRRWGIAAARERIPSKHKRYIERDYDDALFDSLIDK